MAAAAAAELPGKYQKLAQEYSKVPGPGRGGEAVPQPRGAEVPVAQRGAFPSDTCKAVLWSDKGAEGLSAWFLYDTVKPAPFGVSSKCSSCQSLSFVITLCRSVL